MTCYCDGMCLPGQYCHPQLAECLSLERYYYERYRRLINADLDDHFVRVYSPNGMITSSHILHADEESVTQSVIIITITIITYRLQRAALLSFLSYCLFFSDEAPFDPEQLRDWNLKYHLEYA